MFGIPHTCSSRSLTSLQWVDPVVAQPLPGEKNVQQKPKKNIVYGNPPKKKYIITPIIILVGC